jgi:hypothetical protein
LTRYEADFHCKGEQVDEVALSSLLALKYDIPQGLIASIQELLVHPVEDL